MTFAIAPHAHFLPPQGGRCHGGHDLVRPILRHLDQGEAVRDLDGAKFARRDTGLS